MTKRRGNRNNRRSGPDTRVLVMVGIVVSVVALIAVVIVTMGGDDHDGPPEFGVVDVVGSPLPVVQAGPDVAVGMDAPSFRSEGPHDPVRIAPGDGTPHVLFFMAHWCPYCQRELPKLVDMWNAGDFDGVEATVVLIRAEPSAPNYPPSSWLDRDGWEGARAYDDRAGSLDQAFGVSGLPYMVLVDGDGSVVGRLAGQQPTSTIRAALDLIRE